jgi:hypothetical protein
VPASSLAPAGLVLRLSLAPVRVACSAETAAATAQAHRSVMSMPAGVEGDAEEGVWTLVDVIDRAAGTGQNLVSIYG